MKSTARSLILLAALAAPAVGARGPVCAAPGRSASSRLCRSWRVCATLLLRRVLPAVPPYYRPCCTGRRSGCRLASAGMARSAGTARSDIPTTGIHAPMGTHARLPIRILIPPTTGTMAARRGSDSTATRRGLHRRPLRGPGGRLRRLGPAPERRPGEHELTVYLKGYQTYRENVLFRPGAAAARARVAAPRARPAGRRAACSAARTPSEHPRRVSVRGCPATSWRSGAFSAPGRRVTAVWLALRARQPLDAEVIVDGEPWKSPDAAASRCSSRKARTRSKCARTAIAPTLRRSGCGAETRPR